MPSSISDLPIEIINRILAVGCEELYGPPYDPMPRRMKPLAETASMVCRDWRDLVYSPSNCHLWSTSLTLEWVSFFYQDTAKDMARFKDLLLKSCRSDLEVFLSIPEDDEVARLMLHAVVLLSGYSQQIRAIIIHSPPIRALVSVLDTLKPMPRLAKFALNWFTATELADSPHDVFSSASTKDTLDISTAGNCLEVSLLNWGLQGEITFPLHTTFLNIRYSRTLSIRWKDIALLLDAHPCLTSLTLRNLILKDTPSFRPASEGGSNTVHTLAQLQTLKLQTDIVSSYILMASCYLPNLSLLQLDLLYSPEQDDVPQVQKSLPSPSTLASLLTLDLSVRSQLWTVLEEGLLQSILPPHMKFAAFKFSGGPVSFSSPPLPFASKPITTVADLIILSDDSQIEWSSFLSRWNAETMDVRRLPWSPFAAATGIPSVTEDNRKSVAFMESLHTLTIASGYFISLLSQLNAPQLQSISVLASDASGSIETLPIYVITDGRTTTYKQVRDLEMKFGDSDDRFNSPPWEPVFESFLSFLPGVTTLTLEWSFFDCQPVDEAANVESLLQTLWNPCTCSYLSELTLYFEWRRNAMFRIEVMESEDRGAAVAAVYKERRHLEERICGTLSTVCKLRSDNGCSLTARLFVGEILDFRDSIEKRLVWSLSKPSADVLPPFI